MLLIIIILLIILVHVSILMNRIFEHYGDGVYIILLYVSILVDRIFKHYRDGACNTYAWLFNILGFKIVLSEFMTYCEGLSCMQSKVQETTSILDRAWKLSIQSFCAMNVTWITSRFSLLDAFIMFTIPLLTFDAMHWLSLIHI